MKIKIIPSTKEVIKVLAKFGFYTGRSKRHIIMEHENFRGRKRTVTIPRRKEIVFKTFKSILKQAGITQDEFIEKS